MAGATFASVWPWLVVAGLGALHGLSPAGGWPLAAACGVRAGSTSHAGWALLPIGLGQVAAVVLVAAAVPLGLSIDRTQCQLLAGLALLAAAAYRVVRPATRRLPWGPTGLALWSALSGGAHGAGLMLVPALMPLCAPGGAGWQAGGPWGAALAAMGLHLAAMLVTSGLMACGLCHLVVRRLKPTVSAAAHHAWGHAWTGTLALAGALLVVQVASA